jgi:hypothetical protein
VFATCFECLRYLSHQFKPWNIFKEFDLPIQFKIDLILAMVTPFVDYLITKLHIIVSSRETATYEAVDFNSSLSSSPLAAVSCTAMLAFDFRAA